MDQAYAMTKGVMSYISDWRFPGTTDRLSEEQKYSEERAELRRQQQQLEYERQEFFRAKAFEEKRLEKEKRIFLCRFLWKRQSSFVWLHLAHV